MTLPVPWLDIHTHFGSYISALLHAPSASRNVAAVSGYLSYNDVVAIIEEKLNIKIQHENVSVETMVLEAGDEICGLIKEAVELMHFVEGFGFETPRELEGREARIVGVEELEGETGRRVKRGGLREAMRRLEWGVVAGVRVMGGVWCYCNCN